MSKTDLSRPIFFAPNRVRRIYTGGALFADFFGDDSTDSFFPEEWVCSSTKAINVPSLGEKEGISVTREGDYFDDLLAKSKHDLLGDRSEPGILVKILDSAIRLPIQAHPDVPFSQKHFHSNHGKAESWVILATREDACIYFGFSKKLDKKTFMEAANGGDEAVKSVLNRVPVKAGDVFYIPARAVHAIGAGCLILETQEPTDFTIQPERTCADYVLTEEEKYLGLSREDALDVFDFDLIGEDAIRLSRKTGKRAEGKELLITEEDTPHFAVNRYRVGYAEGETLSSPLIGPAVYVVTEGKGRLSDGKTAKTGDVPLKKGDYFFMPYLANGNFRLQSDCGLTVIECLPPTQN